MAGLQVFTVCAAIFTAVAGSHMQGGTVSFRATEKTQMGWLVDFTYKSSFIDNFGEQFFWYCNGDCGYEIDRWIEPVENKTWFPGRWFQYEGYIRRRVDNDKPFEFWENSCCWVYNIYNVGGWMLTASVDLGIRSDTQTPNSSPVTTTIPVLRIPQNCGSTINIFGHDPDGDHVSCRYGYYYGECSSCIWNFYIDERRCTLSVPSWSTTGSYVMELILEDFPKNNIYLMYNDGTRVYKYPKLNRKSREVPKDSQKYWYWYSTYTYGSDSTYYGDTSWTTESVTETGETSTVWPELTSGMHSTQDYYTSDYPDITTSVYEDFPLHTTYETVADTVTESVTESVTGASSTVMTPGMHSTQEYYTSDYPDITTSVYEDFPLHTTYETVADIVTESVTNYVTETSSPPEYTTHDWYYPTYQPPSLNSLSKISLQFLVEVTSSVPSCTIGLYIPKFVSPTPTHGEKLLMNAGRAVQLHLSAQAAYESVSDFLVSGPPGITKSFTSTSRSTTWNMVVEWTPSENHVGGHIPFCFVAETYGGYQSEMRCVIVVVGPNHLDNMELSCHENTMTLIVEKSADHELYENQFRLNDPQCLVSSNSTHLIASVAYNTCGTEIEETEDDIVFKNQATSFSDKVSVITREHGVAIPFNCSFPKETRVSASFRAHKSDYVFTEAGFGKFTYKFQFYTDDRFVDVETQYPLEATLRQLLYMEIQVSASVPNVQLFVESCKAAPHDNPSDPTFYHLIQNGCIRDETLVVYSENRTDFRFAVEAFAFIGDYSEVYISCTVILCKLGKPGTRCSQGCVTKSLGGANRQRYRRALTSESQQHFISQGPLRMKRQSPSDGDHEASASVNVNTLVISISGVAVAAALGVIVYLYAKRHRLSGYNLLKTQDF